jgi:N-acyl-D-aspartate/D-glutamate deacylase
MKKLLTVALLGMATSVFAQQDYVFKVLGTKGNNTADGIALKVGTKLRSGQRLQVSEGAYIDLAHTSGKAINLKSKGNYQISDLASRVGSMPSTSSKYADFVIKELTKDDELSAAKNRFQHMHKTGSVSRGIEIAELLFPNATEVYGQTISLLWKSKTETAGKVRIVITDMNNEVLYNQVTADDFATINLEEAAFANQEHLIVRLMPENVAVDKHTIDSAEGYALVRITSAEQRKNIDQELTLIFGDQAKTALNYLIAARMFEDKQLYADAAAAYEEALRLSENAEMYQTAFIGFKMRMLGDQQAAADNK